MAITITIITILITPSPFLTEYLDAKKAPAAFPMAKAIPYLILICPLNTKVAKAPVV
jgi:hypothetical protein